MQNILAITKLLDSLFEFSYLVQHLSLQENTQLIMSASKEISPAVQQASINQWMGLIPLLAGLIVYYFKHLKIIRQEKNRQLQEAAQLQTLIEQELHQKTALENEIAAINQQLAIHALHLLDKNEKIQKVYYLINEIRQQSNLQEAQKQKQKLLRLIHNSVGLDKDWSELYQIFEQIPPNFYKVLKTKCPQLSMNEMYFCALLKANISTAEIISLLGINDESLRIKQIRLRKKMGEQVYDILPNTTRQAS